MKAKFKQFNLRCSVPREEYDGFKDACGDAGESMNDAVKRFIAKVGRRDEAGKDLLSRVRA